MPERAGTMPECRAGLHLKAELYVVSYKLKDNSPSTKKFSLIVTHPLRGNVGSLHAKHTACISPFPAGQQH